MRQRLTTLDERCAAMRVRLDTEAENRNRIQAMTVELHKMELLLAVAERQFEDATEAAVEAKTAAQKVADAQTNAKHVMTRANDCFTHLTIEIAKMKKQLQIV